MDEEKGVTEGKEESSEEKPSPKKSPVLLLAIIVVVQIVAAWAVAQFLIIPRMTPEETLEVAEEAPARGNIFLIEGLVVTMMDGSGTRFLKITPGLECENGAVEKELEARLPEVRDMLIDRISSLSVAEVVAREGRDYLKGQILEDLNGTLQEGKLLKVYFSEFVVQ